MFIVDRGFRDVAGELEHLGYEVRMPSLLGKKEVQFTTEAANLSRKVTLYRWVVEAVNGRVKNVFAFFRGTIEGTHRPNLMKYFRIACALLNCYFVALANNESEHRKIVDKVKQLEKESNTLKSWVEEKQIEGRLLVADWTPADARTVDDFPKLTWEELKEIFLGVYQLRIGARYVSQHINDDGDFKIFVYRHSESNSAIISAKLQSRFRSNVKHLLWVKFDSRLSGVKSVQGVYCRCQVGARTIGSCGHIAAVSKMKVESSELHFKTLFFFSKVLRYLSYDRYQEPSATRKRKAFNVIDARARIREFGAAESDEDVPD